MARAVMGATPLVAVLPGVPGLRRLFALPGNVP